MTEHACIDCSNLPGCRLLRSSARKLVLNERKILLRGAGETCTEFEPLSDAETRVRNTFDEMVALPEGMAVETLFYRESESVQDPEIEEEEVEDIPDFQAMLWDGITVEEREEQLKYVTDDGQTFEALDDEGSKVPRGSFPLRNYLIHVLDIPAEVVGFWKTKELIDAILHKEHELGLIVKESKKESKKMPKMMKGLNKRKAAQTEAEETNETTGAEETTSGPATAKRTPAKKKTTSKRGTSKAMAKADAEEAAPAALDLGPLTELIEAKFAELEKRIDAKLEEATNTSVVATTLLHDAMITKVDTKIGELAECAGIEGVAEHDEEELLYTGDDPQTVLAYAEGEE